MVSAKLKYRKSDVVMREKKDHGQKKVGKNSRRDEQDVSSGWMKLPLL